MYTEYFGLNQLPFRITPDTQLFYSGGERGATLDALEYAVVNGEGITKVVGEVGSGKTMLLRMLAERLPKHIDVVFILNPTIGPDKILHALALEMGLKVAAGANHLQVMHSIHDHLLKKHAKNRQVVVFIEEAHLIPLDSLEQIRLLSNLETQHHKLLQIVLFGQPELDQNLQSAHVRQIKERITNSFYLKPLSVRDVRDYILLRLRLAGYRGADMFSNMAVRLLSFASKGLMRRVNILADKALLCAYARNNNKVTMTHAYYAIQDSEFGRTLLRSPLKWLTAGLAMVVLAVVFALVQHTPPGLDEYVEQALPLKSEDRILADTIEPTHDGSLVEKRLEATQRWLKNVDKQSFSIQVLTTNADEVNAVEQLLSAPEVLARIEDVYVYRTRVSGDQKIGMLFGNYVDVAAAKSAIGGLPSTLKQYQPYVRNVSQIDTNMSGNNVQSATMNGENRAGNAGTLQ